MPDTGAPWNIPYVAGTDLVSDWPTDSLALANAIASGLDDASGLIAVKHAIKTDTQVSSSIAAGASVAVSGLSITHTLADAANTLIISAYFGAAANNNDYGAVGIAIADDGSLINLGDAASTRSRVTAGGRIAGAVSSENVTMPSVTFVYAPGDTASHTYAVHAINTGSAAQTLYINRNELDTDNVFNPRATSALVIQEVKV